MKSYGQFCGLARALDLIGDRWSMLIIRDLFSGPLRFGDLREGLPGIPTNILTSRLNQLIDGGVVLRSADAGGGRAVVRYRLTEHGAALAGPLSALGRWGASTMVEPAEGEVVTDRSLAAALLAGHTGRRMRRRVFQIEADESAAHARVSGSTLEVGAGAAEAPDLVVAGPGLRQLLAHTVTPGQALRSKQIQITGPRALLDEFTTAFHVPLEPES
ncbi:winged helix-turn-helix transcriptional regulator [Propionibacteriaceae bacterium Y1685]|uniref:winged helix-turn-helix transcriptional regulator n=1 Tax=Microlunatus sp. Y1700 TaxID=3418487 RepID=UPI003B76618D